MLIKNIHSLSNLTSQNLNDFSNRINNFTKEINIKKNEYTKNNRVYSNRRTCRHFKNGGQISKSDFDFILDNAKRSYPSAGGFYDVFLCLFIFNVEGIEEGIYSYNFEDEVLLNHYQGNVKYIIESANIQHNVITASSLCILFCANTTNYYTKYGERGYRFILLESGHLSQNIINLSMMKGLDNFSCGGYLDDKYAELLDLSDCEIITHQIALGIKG